MILDDHRDDFVPVVEIHTCPFHKIAPGEPYPGCTCSGSYSQRLATPEERQRNVEARRASAERQSKAYAMLGRPVPSVDHDPTLSGGNQDAPP